MENNQPPHFILVPWFAQGHIIPMIDIARLLAQRNITVSLITTPSNLARISSTVERIRQSGLPIHFVPLPFPSTEFGLPENCENLDSLPSRSLIFNFYNATKALKQPLIDHLHRQETPAPSCVINDFGHAWTSDIAGAFNVPRFVFQGYSCFALSCIDSLSAYTTHTTLSSDTEPFVIPGLPLEIKINRSQLPRQFQVPSVPMYEEVYKEIRESEVGADGIVINSFDELEVGYSNLLAKSAGKKVFMIGPVSLCNNKGSKDLAERGNKPSIDETKCKSWLDSQAPKCVLYVCFGSMAALGPAQLIELGSGLLASKRPFVWVVKPAQNPRVEEWLFENFSDESTTSCLLIRGWAPQAMILSHVAIGGFLTHCGWNSTLEAVCAGVPMLTWPMFGDQFLNERLIVDVLKTAVAIGVKTQTDWGDVKDAVKDAVTVEREEVEKAVERLMGEGEEREGRMRRARGFGEMGKGVLEEGGSSYLNLTRVVQYALNYHGGKNVV